MSARGASHRLIVDRVEGELVVVEVDGDATLDLPRWMLPAGIREGSVIRATARAAEGRRLVELEVDLAETRARRDEAAATLERLRERDPGGDVEL